MFSFHPPICIIISMNSIILGDCLENFSEIPSNSIDLIFTDPPYGVLNTKHVEWEGKIDLKNIENEFVRVLKKDGSIFLFSSWQLWFQLLQEWKTLEFYYEVIIKHSNYFAASYKKRPVNCHEYGLVFRKKNSDVFFNERPLGYFKEPYSRKRKKHVSASHEQMLRTKDEYSFENKDGFRKPISVMEMKSKNHLPKKERTKHPTQKDLDFCSKWIQALSPPKSVILDPFAGSGTTGEAVIKAGEQREFILIEKNEEYFEMIKKRLD